jgi:hypothetical protein
VEPAPIIAAGITAVVAIGLVVFNRRRARLDAQELDLAGASPGEWRAAARDLRAELRQTVNDIEAALHEDSPLIGDDVFPVEALQRNRATLMKAASTDQGEAVEKAYRRVKRLRRYIAAATPPPVAELESANEAANEAIGQLDRLEHAFKAAAKKAGHSRVGSDAAPSDS